MSATCSAETFIRPIADLRCNNSLVALLSRGRDIRSIQKEPTRFLGRVQPAIRRPMKKPSLRKKSQKPAVPSGKTAFALRGVRAAQAAIKRLKAGLKRARKLAKRLKKQLKAAKRTLKDASKTARRIEKNAPKSSPAPDSRRAGKIRTRTKAASKPSVQRTSAPKKVRRPVPSATVKKPVTPAAVPPKRKRRPRRPAKIANLKAPETPAAARSGEAAVALSNPETIVPAAEPSSPS